MLYYIYILFIYIYIYIIYYIIYIIYILYYIYIYILYICIYIYIHTYTFIYTHYIYIIYILISKREVDLAAIVSAAFPRPWMQRYGTPRDPWTETRLDLCQWENFPWNMGEIPAIHDMYIYI